MWVERGGSGALTAFDTGREAVAGHEGGPGAARQRAAGAGAGAAGRSVAIDAAFAAAGDRAGRVAVAGRRRAVAERERTGGPAGAGRGRPSHVDVQLDPHVPVQLVWAAQCEAQSLPQSTIQVFMCWQSKVTPVGSEDAPPSPAPPPSLPLLPAPPSVQVPPAAQVQVVSVQLQEPVHWPCSALCAVQAPAANAASAAKRSVRMLTSGY
jgi:hypothetical protein